MPLNPNTPEGIAFDKQRHLDALRLLNSLKAALAVFPDMRVGQIIDNCMQAAWEGRLNPGPDLFNISNKELAELIENYMKVG